MHLYRTIAFTGAIAATLCASAQTSANASAQGSDPRAKELISAAVRSELSADDHDHSIWAYRDSDKTAEKDAVYQTVETPEGSVRRMTELDGRSCDSEKRQKETERINDFIHDPAAQAKQRKASAHDDQQARELLQMLPTAFIWTIKSDSGDFVTLSFRPDDNFHAPNMEGRVMGIMAGELVIAKSDNRIRSLRGALSDDVRIGFGILGKLRHGGTFDVERREIAPHIWQITETHVHIEGRALFFKTIGTQEDEVKTEWKPSTAKNLEEAAKQLGAG
jgi:hypothetical protein